MGPKRQIGGLVNNELFYFGLLLKKILDKNRYADMDMLLSRD